MSRRKAAKIELTQMLPIPDSVTRVSVASPFPVLQKDSTIIPLSLSRFAKQVEAPLPTRERRKIGGLVNLVAGV